MTYPPSLLNHPVHTHGKTFSSNIPRGHCSRCNPLREKTTVFSAKQGRDQRQTLRAQSRELLYGIVPSGSADIFCMRVLTKSKGSDMNEAKNPATALDAKLVVCCYEGSVPHLEGLESALAAGRVGRPVADWEITTIRNKWPIGDYNCLVPTL